MRYDKGHKESTRRRIIRFAAAAFKRKGLDGVGLAEIMRNAGLTAGGFYGHFSSKEHLSRTPQDSTRPLGASRRVHSVSARRTSASFFQSNA